MVAVAILAALIVLFLRYRKNKEQQDFEKSYDEVKRSATGAYSSSSSSQNNHSNGGGAAQFVYTDEKGIVNPTVSSPNAPTSNTRQPVNSDDSSESEPVVLDQRLDPRHLMSQWDTNGSKVSLADDVDYSRKVLRVINE
ncbi:unnamed protein product [Kluyveromyces dobzhanskii CBS 2104]|uniref:WGS project CCBQ000000000 data, contig 00223 n=1 Tax=Kluyveromyces dobzhanskii CBS 2104 TaxID=1427455 RepID=A0A0A8L7M0_9SACH|nr:unnamed protein product [Kluyveromyces dobzhanskii CBS 2104]